MDTILSSLNALVEKLGGDTTDNKLIVDALNDISAKYGGEADNKLIVDALNDIVENYSGGSADYKLRDITFVNNTENLIMMMTPIYNGDHGVEYISSNVTGNKTTTYSVVGSRETKNGFAKQNILFKVTHDTVSNVTSDGLSIVFTQVDKYLVVEIPLSPKDITLTIS